MAGNAARPQSLDRYAYVAGNPLGGVDPMGTCDWDTGSMTCKDSSGVDQSNFQSNLAAATTVPFNKCLATNFHADGCTAGSSSGTVEKLGTYVETTSGSSSASPDLVAASDEIRAEVQVDKERTQEETQRYTARQLFTSEMSAWADLAATGKYTSVNCADNRSACAGDLPGGDHASHGAVVLSTTDSLTGRTFHYYSNHMAASDTDGWTAYELCLDNPSDSDACAVSQEGNYAGTMAGQLEMSPAAAGLWTGTAAACALGWLTEVAVAVLCAPLLGLLGYTVASAGTNLLSGNAPFQGWNPMDGALASAVGLIFQLLPAKAPLGGMLLMGFFLGVATDAISQKAQHRDRDIDWTHAICSGGGGAVGAVPLFGSEAKAFVWNAVQGAIGGKGCEGL
jgi:hypothetical protein